MAKRQKISPKKSKKLFSKTAKGTHVKNTLKPMRGGIRM